MANWQKWLGPAKDLWYHYHVHEIYTSWLHLLMNSLTFFCKPFILILSLLTKAYATPLLCAPIVHPWSMIEPLEHSSEKWSAFPSHTEEPHNCHPFKLCHSDSERNFFSILNTTKFFTFPIFKISIKFHEMRKREKFHIIEKLSLYLTDFCEEMLLINKFIRNIFDIIWYRTVYILSYIFLDNEIIKLEML